MELGETLDHIIEHPKSREPERLRARRIKMRWDSATIPSSEEMKFIHRVSELLDAPEVCRHLYQGLCKVPGRRVTLGLGRCEYPHEQTKCSDYISLYGGR